MVGGLSQLRPYFYICFIGHFIYRQIGVLRLLWPTLRNPTETWNYFLGIQTQDPRLDVQRFGKLK